jgi:hypothetical protein
MQLFNVQVHRIPFALQMLPGVILGTGLLFQRESPRWLVEKGRVEEARQVLARVRARPIDDERITLELDEIIQDFHGKERLTFFQQGQAIFASKQIFVSALQFFQQWSVRIITYRLWLMVIGWSLLAWHVAERTPNLPPAQTASPAILSASKHHI